MIYRIEQDNYSEDFGKIIYTSSYPGIQNKRKWCWDIDVDIVNTEKILTDFQSSHNNHIEECQKFIAIIDKLRLADEVEKSTDFEDFRKKLFSNIAVPSKKYYVIGDIVNKYTSKEQSFAMFDFMDNHKREYAIKLFIDDKTLIKDGTVPWKNIEESRISACVHSYFSARRGEVQLKALSIQLLGPCSRDAEYDELAELYPEEDSQELVLDKSLPRIALIAGENHGKKDFDSKINRKLREENCIDFIKTNMSNIPEIVSAIEKKNQEQNVDILVIVRGGGNAEDMCIYNNKLLLDAIKNSKIPVVVGIGHKDDKILAERVAVYGASTPTDAANYINRAIGKFWESRKIKKEDNLKLDYEALKEENQNLREENEQLRAEIKRLKNRGIFSRLINL